MFVPQFLNLQLINFFQISYQIQRGTAKFAALSADEDDATPLNLAESIQVPRTSRERVVKSETESHSPKRANFRSRNAPVANEEKTNSTSRTRNFRKIEENKVTESIEKTTRTYRKRPAWSTTTTASPSSVATSERSVDNKSNSDPRQSRKSNFNSRNALTSPKPSFSPTSRSRKVFTTRSSTESSSSPKNIPRTTTTISISSSSSPATTRSPKRIPFTRGNFRPPSAGGKKESSDELEEANYPEHFKALLKAKYKDNKGDKPSGEAGKGYTKVNKPITLPRLEITTKSTSKPVTKYPTRTRSLPKFTVDQSASSTEEPTPSPVRNNLRRPRPTEETRSDHRFSVQPKSFTRPTRFTTRSTPKVEDSLEISTQKEKVLDIPSSWSAVSIFVHPLLDSINDVCSSFDRLEHHQFLNIILDSGILITKLPAISQQFHQ